MSEFLTSTTDGPVVIDDGKANVVSHDLLDALHGALDDIEANTETHAVVIAGRPGQFSGGFDLKEFGKGLEETRDLVIAGADFCNRLLVFPRITVCAITGNAVAAGAIISMACDWRVGPWTAGATTPFKMGLPETAIGMALPIFGIELARFRLAPAYFARATLLAEMFDAVGALGAGYLDELTAPEEVIATATAKAHALSALAPGAVALTKLRAREALHDHIAATTVENVTSMTTGLLREPKA